MGREILGFNLAKEQVFWRVLLLLLLLLKSPHLEFAKSFCEILSHLIKEISFVPKKTCLVKDGVFFAGDKEISS